MASSRNTTSTTPAGPEGRSEAGEIKRKLAVRMAIAGAMIIALLGGLALFDSLGRQSGNEPSAPQYTEPVPVAKKNVTQPVVPAEAPRDEKKAGESNASPDKPIPSLEAPPRPEVAAQPRLPGGSANQADASARTAPASAPVTPAPAASRAPASPPSQATQGQLKAAAPAVRANETRRPMASAEPEGSASPLMPSAPASPLGPESSPRTTGLPGAPSASNAPAPPRLFSGYGVQAGVFADPRRAEELHARLVNAGIASTIESRVQVGPFKTREQAEAARAKLKEMGIEGVLLPPRTSKR